MRLRNYILLLALLSFTSLCWGQQKDRSRPQSPQYLIQQAQALREKDPQLAIKYCQQALDQPVITSNQTLQAEAYVLLGDIFTDIGQHQLAFQRYNQAIDYLSPKQQREELAQIHQRIGLSQYQLQNSQSAESNFQMCRTLSTDQELQLQCQEGLGDVAFQLRNYQDGIQIYDSILQIPDVDSLSIARISAKKTIYYSQQNDLTNAQFNYNQSISNIPNKEVSKKDIAPIREANSSYINQFHPNRETALSLNELSSKRSIPLPEDNLIEENLDLADVAIENNNNEEAEEYLVKAKEGISPVSAPEIKARVFKKSSDFYLGRGDYQKAIDNYREFATVNDQLLQTKQSLLDQQIAIIQGQQQIDLQVKDASLAEKEAALMQSQLASQKIIIFSLVALLSLALIAFYFIWQNVKNRQQANRMLLLKSQRTQMNPHFIFNALNSINNYIAQNDERAANKFLGDFSKLMRLVLEHSKQDFITMAEEIQLLELYLKLEHLRFRDKFNYEIEKADHINYQDLDIPPMLIQPFVENAIWHGLRYKEEVGELLLSIQAQDNQLKVIVRDNGIGRKKSQSLKTSNQQKYKSTGLQNTYKRIELINQVYNKQYQIDIKDLDASLEEAGTKVTITLPYSHDKV